MKASTLLDKQVILLSTGESLGAICDFAIQNEQLVAIKTEKATILFDAIKFGNGIFATKKENCDFPFVLNKLVYTAKGKLLGNVCDVNFSCKGRIKSFVLTTGKSFSPRKVHIVKDVVIMKKTAKKQPAKPQLAIPKLSVGGDFLIGRLCDKDIFFDNELIVKKDSKVTKVLLDKVKRYGKLVELSLHTQEIKKNTNH